MSIIRALPVVNISAFQPVTNSRTKLKLRFFSSLFDFCFVCLSFFKKVFADLFDPLIETKFNFKPNDRQFHDFDLSKLRFPFETSTSFDLNKYVLSSRIRVTRNLSQFTFPTFTTRAERRQVEKHLKSVFDQFDGDVFRLSTIDEKTQENLINVSRTMT